jgi:hypothetical protein
LKAAIALLDFSLLVTCQVVFLTLDKALINTAQVFGLAVSTGGIDA